MLVDNEAKREDKYYRVWKKKVNELTKKRIESRLLPWWKSCPLLKWEGYRVVMLIKRGMMNCFLEVFVEVLVDGWMYL